MNIRLFCLLATVGVISACDGNGPGNKDEVDDTATGDDTGDINYEEGCIALSTGQTFAWMEDALKVAADGDTIEDDFEHAFDHADVAKFAVLRVGDCASQLQCLAAVQAGICQVKLRAAKQLRIRPHRAYRFKFWQWVARIHVGLRAWTCRQKQQAQQNRKPEKQPAHF